MGRPLLIAAALMTVTAAAWFCRAGDPFKPGKLSKDEVAKLERGVTLRFYFFGGARPVDARRARLLALHVPNNDPPSLLVNGGRFTAKLSAFLKLPLRGTYSFQVFGTGTAVLKVNDKEVLRT